MLPHTILRVISLVVERVAYLPAVLLAVEVQALIKRILNADFQSGNRTVTCKIGAEQSFIRCYPPTS